jgi:hypothetical protein
MSPTRWYMVGVMLFASAKLGSKSRTVFAPERKSDSITSIEITQYESTSKESYVARRPTHDLPHVSVDRDSSLLVERE